MNLKTKKDLHLERKIFHVFGASSLFIGLLLFPRSVNLMLLLLSFLFSLTLDITRLKNPKVNQWVLNGWLGKLARAEERHSMSAVTHMIIGVGLCYLLFSDTITALSILFLGFGDPSASTFGLLWGKTKLLGSKSIEGSLAAATVCGLAFLTYSFFDPTIPQGILGVCIAGLIGAVSELIPLGPADDNLSQPLISGALLSSMFYFMT